MKILFITSTRLGDAVLSTGLLDHMIRTYPECGITIACGPLPVSLFEGAPNVTEIISLKKQKNHKHWIDLWKRVSGTRWDMVVDLRNSAVSRLIRAKVRYVHGGHIDKSLHKVQQNAAAMKLDYVPAPSLWPTDEQKALAEELIPDGGFVLGVGPTANWLAKTWPPGGFIELISDLITEDGLFPYARVAAFGAPGEEEQAKPLLEIIPKELCIDLVGKTNPGQAAAALARCNLYIGNDSGLMHLAAAAGTPTVGLFGPSYPHLYAPWGDHTVYARTPETFDDLIDYEGYEPDSAPCLMTSLDVDEVLKTVTDFWKSRK